MYYGQPNKTEADFRADLSRAHDLENQLKQTLESNWNCTVDTTQNNGSDSRFDLIVTFHDGENENITIEVKEDKQVGKTGNIAVEMGRWVYGGFRPTCINATKADVWAYYFEDAFHFIETGVLKKLIADKKYKFTAKGGDGKRALCAIFPKKVIIDNSTILNIE